MKHRIFSVCGVVAPVLFVFTAILGGALRPGYSHFSDTVSELFSPGSPNKLLLDILYTIYALLLVFFGVGVMRFVLSRRRFVRIGVIGAAMFIATGLLSVPIAAIFPQDPWGSPPTFAGKMHVILGGVINLFLVFSMILMGRWLNRTEIFPGFQMYSFISAGAIILSTICFVATVGSPIMGLTERIAVFIDLQWILVLALWMYSQKVGVGKRVAE